MTKKQLEKKVRHLINESVKDMRRKIPKVWLSGAVDLSAYENDYVLPKIVATALLQEEAHQNKPLRCDKETERTIDNIYSIL